MILGHQGQTSIYTLHIITSSNGQMNYNWGLPCKLDYAFVTNCEMSSWKPTKTNVGNNWNLLQMWIEVRGWTCFGQGRFRNANSIICWLLWTICLQWLITHVIVGYNIGAMKQVWLLYLWLQVTSITMNIVGCKDDITHHMTNSNYFFEMEAPHGLLEERLMF